MKIDKANMKRGGWVALCVWCTLAALGSIAFLLENSESSGNLLNHKQELLDIALYITLAAFGLKKSIRKKLTSEDME